MTQKIKSIFITLVILTPVFFAAPALASPVGGAPNPTPTPSSTAPDASANAITSTNGAGDFCAASSNLTNAQTAGCKACDTTDNAVNGCLQNNQIVKDLQIFVNALSGLVGIVIVGSIILGGIQYTMASGSPDSTAKAKKRITDSILALIMFIFLFAFLQYLIPGGVFG